MNRFTAALSGEAGRRLLSLVGVALVAAVVTGPGGSSDRPLSGVRHSLLAPRVVVFLVIAVALWLLVAGGAGIRATAAQEAAPVLATVRRTLDRRGVRPAGYLLLLAAAIVIPLNISAAAQTSAFGDVGVYALLALGLNVVVGYAGLLDLGYIAFFAIGAYTTAYFTSATAIPWHAPFVLDTFFVFPIALAVAALAGVVLGGPTLRLRGDYLTIVTLGFGEIVQLVANNAGGITNGPLGAFGVPHPSVHLFGLSYSWSISPLPYYYLLLGFVVITMVAFSRLERSRVGRALAAIREDEVAAEATGVPTLRYKLLAFAIGASTSGFAGVLFASKQFFNPLSFSLQASILVLTIVIFGGMGSLFGVVVGSVVLQGLFFYLRDKVPPADRYIYFGAVIIAMMVFRPQGLLPSRRRSREITLTEAGIGGADSLGSGAVRP